MHWITLAIVAGVFVAYLLIGAAVFMALEREHGVSMAATRERHFWEFIDNNTCVSPSELSAFVNKMIRTHRTGDGGLGRAYTGNSSWDYGPSIFFSITVVTSIGYGDVSPSTEIGQLFFIFYVLFGVPLTAVFLKGVGEKLAQPYIRLQHKHWFPRHRKAERIIKMLIFTIVCFVLFVAMPAAVFITTEDWTFLQALYYTISTLTTVGFGDLVPGETKEKYEPTRSVYKTAVGVWILIGLSWVSMVLNIVAAFLSRQADRVDHDVDEHLHHNDDHAPPNVDRSSDNDTFGESHSNIQCNYKNIRQCSENDPLIQPDSQMFRNFASTSDERSETPDLSCNTSIKSYDS
ncbi:KCNK2-like protein [Mya arenaria]|uniref:KCNK2-like protein n=1 Tax=Mya arenaria TaxID=6604 RepID=A0ABY7FAA7_MYAAR|nr:potassium channel subfamily K member 16-like [Mya arenaria]WAR18284.1 KCNK2-like protein [Mya arenaria]